MAVNKWIASAVQQPGYLRKRAARMGLLKKDETLTANDLSTMEAHARKTGDTHMLRAVLLARRLKSMH